MNQAKATISRLYEAYVSVYLHGGKKIDGHIGSDKLSEETEDADMLMLTKRADHDEEGVGSVYLIPFASILFIQQDCE